jgi:type IV secretory pathway VirB4 component
MSESGIVETIFNNVATRIFLPNASARNEDAAAFYRRAGLSKTEIDLVAQGTAKADYYIKTEHGSRSVNFRMNKIALAFAEPLREPKKRAAARAFIQRHGPQWPVEWLRQYGKNSDERRVLNQWADRLQSIYEESQHALEEKGLCALSA